MSYDALFQEIRSLPNSMVLQVAEFVRFLRFSMNDKSEAFLAEATTQTSDEAAENKLAKRKGGVLSDLFIAISDDFDETPDCFKEYM